LTAPRGRSILDGVRTSMARSAAVFAAAALSLAACSSEGGEPRLIVDGTALPSATATATATAATPAPSAAPFEPTSPASDLDPEALAGFTFPLAGACLPESETLLPNAPRPYRNGVHEGVDWYHLAGCAEVELGTPVAAMYDGVVVRADHHYVDITPEEVARLEAETAAQGSSSPEALDAFRGRQVWIDHGNGVVTRYAHLAAVGVDVFVGANVEAGDAVGLVGESGTPESLTAPGTEWHLHAEVRLGDSFLGADLPAAEVRALYEALFAAP
jgi:murein DD-endopeptidase MepM/ murein hydrolase activator NlpD